MTADPIAALKALAQQASGLTDAAGVSELLGQARTIAHDDSLPVSRGFGLALLEAATALVPRGEPHAVEDLFLQAQRVFEATGQHHVDDDLLLWHNLGALYEMHGAIEQRNQTMALIGQVATHYTGPLERRGADVLLDMAVLYHRARLVEPMLTMLRQVHRYRTSDASAPADRLSWLQIYTELLLRAERVDDALPLLADAIELAHDIGDAQCEASLLNTSARVFSARGDHASELRALERARTVIDSTPALADTQLAAAVLHNLVGRLLSARDSKRYPEAVTLSERVIDILPRLGHSDSDDFAHALYQRALLAEYGGDWAGAARGYSAAAAVPKAAALDTAEWLSLAGRAWYEVEAFDAASECYLGAIRRRIAASTET
ncbi:MAG: hypothetical protein GEV05_19080 [Betaproteobacteria bacterium]|nr:hypothetical protein [Betaproteobacteria bacterium]